MCSNASTLRCRSAACRLFLSAALLTCAACRFEARPVEPTGREAEEEVRTGTADAAQDASPPPKEPAASAPPPPQSTSAEKKTATSPPAPVANAKKAPRNGRPVAITFDDLALDMPADAKFSTDLLTPRVKELDGRRVTIKGFIYAAGIFQQTGITAFPLVKNTQCKFGPGGQAFCVILVRLKEGVTTDFTLRPITVEGTLKVEPYEGPDGNTWSVYTMVGERVEGG